MALPFSIPPTIRIKNRSYDSTQVFITTDEGVDLTWVTSINWSQNYSRSFSRVVGEAHVIDATPGVVEVGTGNITLHLTNWLEWYQALGNNPEEVRKARSGLNIGLGGFEAVQPISIKITGLYIAGQAVTVASGPDAILVNVPFEFIKISNAGDRGAAVDLAIDATKDLLQGAL